MFERRRISLAPSVRRALEGRCRGACERCGLEWPWALYLFRVEEDGRDTAANLVVLCLACSTGRPGAFAPLVGQRSLRARLLAVSNDRASVPPLTPARRRALIRARGSACELCGIGGGERQLEVHHRTGVLQGGDDSENNLRVLCFACHHRLVPCSTGCGAWASRSRGICRQCLTRRLLENLMPDATWDEIKSRFPSLVARWKPGYEPRGSPGAGR